MEKQQEEAKKPVSNVRKYFTPEITKQINEMGMKEMESVMKAAVTERFWIALLKYTGVRMASLENTLKIAKPIDPQGIYNISWAQGAMAGLCDIENYVIELNAPDPEEEGENKGVVVGM